MGRDWDAWVFRTVAKQARSRANGSESEFWRRLKETAKFWAGWWRRKDGSLVAPKETR